MKKFTLAALCCIVITGFIACDKYNAGANSDLQVSQTGSIQAGQAVTFTLSSVPSTTVVTWSVNPNTATISASGNTAAVTFPAPGSYTVMGVSGGTSGSSTVKVDSSKSTPSTGTPGATVAFAAGEQLNITVKRVDSSTSVSGLGFSIQTSTSYNCLNNYLQITPTLAANAYTLDVTGVYIPASTVCTTGSAKASGKANTQNPFPTGTSQLTINFNGTKYTGTIVKTNNSYTINWAYTSGVVISPTSL